MERKGGERQDGKPEENQRKGKEKSKISLKRGKKKGEGGPTWFFFKGGSQEKGGGKQEEAKRRGK